MTQKPLQFGGYLSYNLSSEICEGVIQLDGDTVQNGNASHAAPLPENEQATPAELLTQIANASASLHAQLDLLRQTDTTHLHQDMIGQGGAKLLRLSVLRDQLVGGAKDVTALRASIASAVADIRAYTSDARSAANAAQDGTQKPMTLQQASEAAHATTADFMRDYYERKIFDPYLRFASVEDQEDYSRREQERKEAMEKAIAEHTPEGDLRAIRLERDQLQDAGAHGANRSPEFQKDLDKLTVANTSLTTAMARPLSQLAQPSADPLDAAKPAAKVPPELAASLQASGIVMPDQYGTGHGINAPPSTSVLGRS